METIRDVPDGEKNETDGGSVWRSITIGVGATVIGAFIAVAALWYYTSDDSIAVAMRASRPSTPDSARITDRALAPRQPASADIPPPPSVESRVAVSRPSPWTLRAETDKLTDRTVLFATVSAHSK